MLAQTEVTVPRATCSTATDPARPRVGPATTPGSVMCYLPRRQSRGSVLVPLALPAGSVALVTVVRATAGNLPDRPGLERGTDSAWLHRACSPRGSGSGPIHSVRYTGQRTRTARHGDFLRRTS